MNYGNCLKIFIASAFSFSIAGCSTMSSTRQAVNLSAITADKTYQLRVRSGNIALDHIIYDSASMKFGEYLRITGGSELPGSRAGTADEAARISLDRIIKQFEKDFIFVPGAAEYESPDKMPGIALIVEDSAPEPREYPSREEEPSGKKQTF